MGKKVILAGASGWAGSAIARGLLAANDLELVAAVAPSHQGKTLGELLDVESQLVISSSVADTLESKADVLVDYTRPDVARANAEVAIKAGIHVVMGTSGLSDEDYAALDELAQSHGVSVLAAGNFAITAVLLDHFATIAAKFIPHWEIIDYGSAGKPDAPSGTVNQLVSNLAKVGQPELTVPVEQTFGVKETRGATMQGMQVHSLRLPGHVLGVDAIFGMQDEKLVLRHEAGSGAAPYVHGTLLAIRHAGESIGLTRGLAQILGLA